MDRFFKWDGTISLGHLAIVATTIISITIYVSNIEKNQAMLEVRVSADEADLKAKVDEIHTSQTNNMSVIKDAFNAQNEQINLRLTDISASIRTLGDRILSLAEGTKGAER